MDDNFARAKEAFLAGVSHYQAGRFDEAHAQFEASLALVPGRPSTLMNLGATRIQLGHFAQAAEALEEATRLDPSDAQAWGHRATALAELGQYEEALRCADEALKRDSRLGQVWSVRGLLLRDLQRPQEAVDAFRKAIESGADPELHRYYIAALTGDVAPSSAPARYVQSLFDSYAEGFEDHLVDVLRYDAPRILAEGLPAREWARAVDLGCGTGLMGQQLRSRVGHLVGVDLSANMLARAQVRGVYDELVQADAGQWLSAAEPPFDLIAAADVFNYIGDLRGVFASAARLLAPEGRFVFTVELARTQAPAQASAGVVLQPSMRFAHSREYIEGLASTSGFDVAAMAEHPIREDQREPIPGLFAWLVRR